MTYNKYRMTYSRRSTQEVRNTMLWRARNNILFEWALSVVEPSLWLEREIEHRERMPDGSELFFNRDTVMFSKRAFDGSEAVFRNLYVSLDRLQKVVENVNADLVFMLLPSKEEIFAADVAARHDSAVGVLMAELDRRGIVYLDLYPLLQDAGRRHTPFYVRDVHLNAQGNKVVADAFIRWAQASQAER